MLSIPWLLKLLVTGGVTVSTIIYALLKFFPWLKYDYVGAKKMLKAGLQYKIYQRKNMTTIELFEDRVKRHPQKKFILFEDQSYSYEYINKMANKVANSALRIGLKKKDVVAMLMYNEPAFIWTYFGLIKIGVEPAFLNFNLRSKSLLHCFKVSDATALIIGQGTELCSAVEEIYSDMSNNNNKVDIYVQGSDESSLPEGFNSFDAIMEKASDAPISRTLRHGITFKDTLNYIYTSGTTGLPKAAVVTHAKGCKGSLLMDSVDVTSDDVLYTPLPLYHSAAGLIALGTTIHKGATLALRNKFSATHFFPDCKKYNVTVIQYIGELCRYLLARPPSPSDRDHRVRIAFGNGLRNDIWEEFQTRFGIDVIGEFYAATEGNGGFINFFNKKGAIGRGSPLMAPLLPMYFIRYDVAQDDVIRGADGLCQMIEPGETGLMVSQIRRDFEFDGYKGNRELSDKKVIRDVFKKGDVYFNTGDLLAVDKDYFVYFSDRIGDTFRWKGENVSTIEVSNVVADLSWIEDACVYGVQIPGQDGRCGMAAVTLIEGHTLTSENLVELYKHCADLLPAYACPRFLRFQRQLQITGTFKQQKFNLIQEGYDPAKCGDDTLYCIDMGNKTFQEITDKLLEDISSGKVRL